MTRTHAGLHAALAAALLWPSQASAKQLPWLHDVFADLQRHGIALTESVGAGLASPQVAQLTDVLFTTIATGLFVWRFAGFALRGFDLDGLLTLVITITLNYLLLTSYRAALPVVMSAGSHIGSLLGHGLTGGATSQSMAEDMFSALLRISVHPKCGGPTGCLSSDGPMAIISASITQLALLALGLLAMLVEVWAHWTFAVAYAVGWVTIPFLMVRSLSFLFDGWLKFFCSIVTYDWASKLTLGIVMLSFKAIEVIDPGATSAAVDLHGLPDAVPLLLFLLLGIGVLMATGTISRTLVAGVSGVGGVLDDMIRRAAGAASR